MEMLPITYKYIPSYSCVDMAIHALCTWKKKDYVMMFSESWGFKYENKVNVNDFEGKLNADIGMKYELLKEYHGIELEDYDSENKEQLFEFVKSELENNNPVGVIVDIYWCPWFYEAYKKAHGNHYLLVIGIDEENDELICKDFQMAIDGKTMTKKQLKEACLGCTKFNYVESVGEISIEMILKNAVDRIYNPEKNIDIIEDINKFGSDLKLNLNINEVVKGYEDTPYLAPLLKKIKEISKGRSQFAITLTYIMEKKNVYEIRPIIHMLSLAAEKWDTVVGMLIKSYYLENRGKIIDRISNKILEIATLEKSIIHNIKEVLENREIGLFEDICNHHNYDSPIKEVEFVDLRSQLNSRGISIGNEKNVYAELSNPGRYIIVDNIPNDGVLCVANMRFDINNIVDSNLDNISCDEQEINIKGYEAEYIMILACAEFGNYSEEIDMIYDDGECENIRIRVSSWLLSESKFDELTAIKGKGAVRLNEKIEIYPFPVTIFAQCHEIKKKGRIVKIKMPVCPSIHVFAISLGR